MPRKLKRKAKPLPGRDILAVAGLESLDAMTVEVLKVSKEEIERREALDTKKPS